MQTLERIAPLIAIDQVIPFRDQVVDRAAIIGLAERYTTIHATGALLLQTGLLMICLLYTSPSPRDQRGSRMPSSA